MPKQLPNHFLAAGVYGCVYYPGYTCKGVSMKKKKWVSKLTYPNERTNAEIELGAILKKIPNYQDHFIVVEKSCNIPYKSMTRMKEGCDLAKKNRAYSLLYSTYVSSVEFYDYLQQNTLFIRIPRYFFQLCESIQLLLDQRIVHHDLHFSNILYAKETSKLLIIDFGLSIDVSRFHESSYLKDIFSRYMPEWNWYSLEIHMLTYLIQHGSLTTQIVEHTLHMYLEKHVVYQQFPLIRSQFKKDADDFFLPMVHWTREETIEYLLGFWHTWDFYEVALRFLYLYSENKVHYPAYLDHLLSLLYANPEKRPNVLEIRNAQKKVIRSFDLTQSKQSYVLSHKNALPLSVGIPEKDQIKN